MPGIQPANVSRKTMTTEPHPLSTTASGGKITDSMTRRQDIAIMYLSQNYKFISDEFVLRLFFSLFPVLK